MTRVLICTPAYSGEVNYRYTESVMAATVYCLFHQIQVELKIAARMTLLEYARAYLAAKFLEGDYTHLMWIDADLGFDPRAIVKLVKHDKDIVGGVYPVKSIPVWFPYEPIGEPQGSLQKVKSLPGGFLLVSRRAMQAVAESVPTFEIEHQSEKVTAPNIYQMEHRGSALMGEDVMFCERARKCGLDLWVDPDIDFVHVGMFEWGGNLAGRIAREKAEAEKTPVASLVRETLRGAA